MKCKTVKEQLGLYLDGELTDLQREGVRQHLETCPSCSKELIALQKLVRALKPLESPTVPTRLWMAIEQKLDHAEQFPASRHRRVGWFWRRPRTIAAGFLLAIGLVGSLFIWPEIGIDRAQASSVNFDMLLSGLSLNPNKAIRRFLVLYDARAIYPKQAREYAPNLSFDLPDKLPGDYHLGPVYGLRFGGAAGIAAKYIREPSGDFLTVIFHPPVQKEDFGTHRDFPCVIGRHHGHKVSVGRWNLVHVTGPTTCHCVLSKIQDSAQLSPILTAIAPCAMGAESAHAHSPKN